MIETKTKGKPNWLVAGIITGMLIFSTQGVGFSALQTTEVFKKIVIGVQATKPEETRAAWLPLVADMGKKLGVETDIYTASQTDIVNALRDGKVDVAWLSSNVAIDAVTNANAEAFALYYNLNGTNGYKGVIITRNDTGIKTIDQALSPGKYSYACGPKTSTSGYVLPQYFLFSKRNTTPEQLFTSVIYDGHLPNLESLMNKKVDVIANNTTDLATFQAKTPAAKDTIVVLWVSPLVPNDVLMYRKDMAQENKKCLSDFFMNYGIWQSSGDLNTEKENLKKASNIAYFIQTNIKLLEPVSEFKFATEHSGIEQDGKLTVGEKAERLQDLDKRIAIFKKALAETK